MRRIDEIREQIEQEVRADMFHGVRVWVERFSPGDRWDPQDDLDLESALLGIVEANTERSRARGGGDAHRPERCPMCGCELAYSTAVHVVDCGEGSE